MIYLILDVHYQELDNQTIANVSGIRFAGIENHIILNEYRIIVNKVEPYQSGQFYKRELPCLLALIEKIDEPFDVIVIDGYVYLNGTDKAGLGKYLYDNLPIKKPVIGIAKARFCEIGQQYAVHRGMSKHPLYVTCVDFELNLAKNFVQTLQGKNTMPDIAKRVDLLSRHGNNHINNSADGMIYP